MDMNEQKWYKTVFLGDSITEGYGVGAGECWVDFMPGIVVNHGISGDTTDGMCRRFEAHVLREKPRRVVIMGGINDLSEGRSLEQVKHNLTSLYDGARSHAIVPVAGICVTPDYDELLHNEWADTLPAIARLPERLRALDAWIREYCERHNLLCLDFARYFPDYTQEEYCRYFVDGIHPNARGHAIMARIALELLTGQARQQKNGRL